MKGFSVGDKHASIEKYTDGFEHGRSENYLVKKKRENYVQYGCLKFTRDNTKNLIVSNCEFQLKLLPHGISI